LSRKALTYGLPILGDGKPCCFQGLNAGVPHVRSHRKTVACGIVASPFLIAAHCRSSPANSSE
jgi:hypothetical protein